MREGTDRTQQLADVIVAVGANVQPGQVVGITAATGQESLARAVAGAAYRRGARWVDVLTIDMWVKRARLELAPLETLSFVPPWMLERIEWISDEWGSRISLRGPSQPDALVGVDPARAGLDHLPYLPNTMEIVNARQTNWCVAPCPSAGWAALVYPDLGAAEALDRLWEAIVHVCRLDEPDPQAAWLRRRDELQAASARLDELRLDAVRFAGPGTDLTVGLFPSSTWRGGGSTRKDGLEHFSNLPTEEVFTTPDPQRVDGVVRATRPLERYGSFVDGIRVEFRGGRAVKIDADVGADVLRTAAAEDEGACRLGEVALVDGSGRIGKLGTIFYETLLDENAASHIALGSGYATGVADDADRGRVNRSTIHIDFMVGGDDVDVDGITRDGRTLPLLRRGAWQL
ncbi:MAG: aminopeptidase [Actinobacteria bacterium]|nr:aminopeptidase [Actinomycetota bacterium]